MNEEKPAQNLIKYCLYARKSTEEDERQALSIESQIKEVSDLAQKAGLNVLDIRKESHSAKASGTRPIYNELLEDVRKGTFSGILTWAPDRLSRNAGDLGAIVDLMDQGKLLEIRTYGQTFTNTPSEKFLLMILCSQAKLENDNKSVNVKRGMKTRVDMGLWPHQAPTGYLNHSSKDKKCQVYIDPVRGPVIRQVFENCASGWSGRKLFSWLKEELDFKTSKGKHLSLSNIYTILQNTFYYGEIEYPKNSGRLYQAKHEPLISKELHNQVQRLLKDRQPSDRTISKEFAFTRLLKCGLCGSGVTAYEKFKNLKNGSVNRYVYYTCTRSRDINCKAGYTREFILIEQLQNLVDEVSLDKLGIKEKVEQELQRYKKFRKMMFGLEPDVKETAVDAKSYVKYILEEGEIYEKREILSNLKTKIILKNNRVILE